MAVTLIPLSAAAHRQHFGWSSVVYRQAENLMEITHRIHAHDVALLMSRLKGAEVDITLQRTQAEFILHMEDQFELLPDVSVETIETLGAELDGPYLVIYQSLELVQPAGMVTLDASILMDLLKDQIHLINFKVIRPGQQDWTDTIEFDIKTPSKVIQLNSL